ASRPRGAAAPKPTVAPFWTRWAARRATGQVGSMSVVGWRTTRYGWRASNSSHPVHRGAYTTTESGGRREASPCTKAWIPPARGGKSLVMINVRCPIHHPRLCRAGPGDAGEPPPEPVIVWIPFRILPARRGRVRHRAGRSGVGARSGAGAGARCGNGPADVARQLRAAMTSPVTYSRRGSQRGRPNGAVDECRGRQTVPWTT